VQVTNVNGHPVLPDYGAGPMEAVESSLQETDALRWRLRERFLTMHLLPEVRNEWRSRPKRREPRSGRERYLGFVLAPRWPENHGSWLMCREKPSMSSASADLLAQPDSTSWIRIAWRSSLEPLGSIFH
jgi:hypothetical protein